MDNQSFKPEKNDTQDMSGPIKASKILIVVPAFNEAANIQFTINEINSLHKDYDIIVVDDGSKDDTSHLAKMTSAKVITLPYNLGIGGAVQTGIKYAYENDYDFVAQVDGDSQHDANFLKTIVDPVIKGEADMVIGSRFIPPFLGYQSSFVRRIGIQFFAKLISFLTGTKITDPTSGFRCFNRKLIAVFANYYPTDYPEPEAIVVAKRHQAKVIEVPVEMRKRAKGNSSIRYLYTLYYMIKVTFAVVLDKCKPSKKLH